MNAILVRYAVLWLIAIAAIISLTVYANEARLSLGRSEFITGYALFALMLALAIFNTRKKLSMVPLGRVAYWLAFHAVGGMVAIAIFFVHTGSFWPSGAYEQALAVTFYMVSLSGIFGYIIQRYYPKRLVQSDFEIIYERIPAEIAEVREKAEAAVRACADETGSDTLARHYLETMRWYFRKPRFYLNHALGGQAGEHWISHQHQTIDRYLNDAERAHLETITALARYKNDIDLHYACQSIMKMWLLVHVPLAAAVLGLMFWHVIVVNVYAL